MAFILTLQTVSLMDNQIPLIMAALVQPSPDHTAEVQEMLTILLTGCHVPHPTHGIRLRHFADDNNAFGGKDVFTEIADNRYAFYQITEETTETFIELLTFISLQPSHQHLLSQRNRLLMFIIWLKMYPTYYFLSNLFSISLPVVGREITNNLPLFCE